MQAALNCSYLDAFLENAENIIDHNTVRVDDGVPNEKAVKELQTIYQELDLQNMKSEIIRQIIQLSFLKVIRKDAIQANHQMTPDTIGLIMAFLIEKVTKTKEIKTVFDPAVGPANLLTTVLNQLKVDGDKNIAGFGIENDEDMLFHNVPAKVLKNRA